MNEATTPPKACAEDCPCPCHGDADEPGPHLPCCAFADPDYVPEGFEEAMRAVGREMRNAAAEAFGVSPDKVEQVWLADYRTSASPAPDGPGSVPPPSSGVAVNVPAAVLANENDVRGIEVSEVPGDVRIPVRLVGPDRGRTTLQKTGLLEALTKEGGDPVETLASALGGRPRCMVTKIVSATLEVRCRRARHDDQAHDFGAEDMQQRTTSRPWFLTLTGHQFFYDEPEAYPYDLEEIAFVLAKECRFSNHTPTHYSVAEHSVLVAEVVYHEGMGLKIPPSDLLPIVRGALLHDASEAFLRDLPRPLKHLPEMAPYRRLEDRVQLAILRRYGLEDFLDRDVIKRADQSVLRAEKDQLRGGLGYQRSDIAIPAAAVTCRSLAQPGAQRLFLEAWDAYGGQR